MNINYRALSFFHFEMPTSWKVD